MQSGKNLREPYGRIMKYLGTNRYLLVRDCALDQEDSIISGLPITRPDLIFSLFHASSGQGAPFGRDLVPAGF